MKDLPTDPPSDAPETDAPHVAAPNSWLDVGIAMVVAVGMWLCSIVLPDKEPVGSTFATWLGFAQMLLRDTLRAAAALSVGVAVAMLTWRRLSALGRRVWTCDRRRFLAVLVIVGTAQNLWWSYYGLNHMGHITDEVAVLFQAKNFALGQLYAEAPPADLVPFFDHEWIVIDGDRWYSKFCFGPSLILVPGLWLGMPWIVNPILGGLTILLFYGLGRELVGERLGRVAALLSVISYFRMANSAWMMSHGGCVFFASLFALCLLKAAREPTRYRYTLIAGLAFGMTFNFRPLTAVAMGIPLGVAALFRCRWDRVSANTVLSLALPLLLFAGLFFGYNKALTGDALVTPFERWSANERLGFGSDVGLDYLPTRVKIGLNPERALLLLEINLDALGISLLRWGRGTLLLLVVVLLVKRARSRYLLSLIVVGTLLVAHFFYYSAGVLYGMPRYWSEAMGFIFVLAAGGLAALRLGLAHGFRLFGQSNAGPRARVAVWVGAVLLTAGAIRELVPELKQLHKDAVLLTPALRDTVKENPPQNAVVFVPSNWYREVYFVDKSGAGMLLNSPNLDGEIVFARDRGDQANLVLLEHFPDRKAYRFVDEHEAGPHFEPISRSASASASAPSGQ